MSTSSRVTTAIPDTARAAVRQGFATLAYRAAKTLRDAPASFATFRITPQSRSATEIMAHMADLMRWGVWLARGEHVWKAEGTDDWNLEVERFFAGLAEIDAVLAADEFNGSIEKLIQGPLADALTHVGQLNMMRGAAGMPVRPESYARAEITAGRVGRDQATAKAEFDGDASRPASSRA